MTQLKKPAITKENQNIKDLTEVVSTLETSTKLSSNQVERNCLGWFYSVFFLVAVPFALFALAQALFALCCKAIVNAIIKANYNVSISDIPKSYFNSVTTTL